MPSRNLLICFVCAVCAPPVCPLSAGLYIKQSKEPDVGQWIDCGSDQFCSPLELSAEVDDDDLFTIQVPESSDMDGVLFVLNNMEALTHFVNAFKGMRWLLPRNLVAGSSLAHP